MEERPDAQKQILAEIAKKLPIFTRAQSGGKLSYWHCHWAADPGALATIHHLTRKLCLVKASGSGQLAPRALPSIPIQSDQPVHLLH